MKRESNASPAAEFLAAELMNTRQIEADTAQKAFDTFDTAKEEIIGNTNGGAGFFAEAHHAASCGLTRIGSNEFGSADMVNDDGQAFNPKYYASAEESYKAGAELIKDPITGIETAKYAGDVIVVASDQIDQATALHQQSIQDALNAGNQAQAEALQSISFLDHAYNGKLQSTPLSYEEAKQGQDLFGDGVLPDYAHETSFLDDAGTATESGLFAFIATLAIELTPTILSSLNNIKNGTGNAEDLKSNILNTLKEKELQQRIGKTTGLAVSAGMLAIIDGIDATGATIIVGVAGNVSPILKAYNANEITKDEMVLQIGNVAIRKSGWAAIALTGHVIFGLAGGFATTVLARVIASKAIEINSLSKKIEEKWSDNYDASFDSAKTQAQVVNVQESIITSMDEDIATKRELKGFLKGIVGN